MSRYVYPAAAAAIVLATARVVGYCLLGATCSCLCSTINHPAWVNQRRKVAQIVYLTLRPFSLILLQDVLSVLIIVQSSEREKKNIYLDGQTFSCTI